jgi:hypothetical protein
MKLFCTVLRNLDGSVRRVSPSTHIFCSRLTNSMEQSPSWEANSHSASQEIPSLFMVPEGSVYIYRVSYSCVWESPMGPSPSMKYVQSLQIMDT